MSGTNAGDFHSLNFYRYSDLSFVAVVSGAEKCLVALAGTFSVA